MKLQQAAALNQQGANLLSLGDYDAAYRVLSESVTILRDLLVLPPQGEQVASSLISAFAGCKLSALERADFHIFNRDFQFHIVLGDATTTSLCQKRFCIAMVMFNMALGRHSQAKKLGRDLYLEKAMSLYSMSLEVLQQVQVRSECVNILAIAALNNMAEACYELGDVARANQLLECIPPLAALLSEPTVTRNQLDECQINALVAGCVTTARCA